MREDVMLIVVLYVLPALSTALFQWFDEKTKTVGDFLEFWWVMLCPIFNIFAILILIMHYFIDKLEKTKLRDNWTKFKNIRIK